MVVTAEEVNAVYQSADRLYSPSEVDAAIKALGQAISQRLAEKNPLVLTVMNGALIPTAKLLDHLQFPLRQDYIHATRYRSTTLGGELDWIHRPQADLTDQHILVVDDILDEGITLAAIVDYCREAGAKKVLSAVLVEKLHPRGNGMTADFVGLKVEDRYVFGYGMDYKGYLRNAPGIFAVAGT